MKKSMTKTLNIYLLKNFWQTLFLIIFTFIFLVVISDVLDHLDFLTDSKVPFIQYVMYYVYSVPYVFTICLPVAVLLAGMRLFRYLSISNEYVALIMGGISLQKMIYPIAASVVFLCFCSFYITDNIAPIANYKRSVMKQEKFKADLNTIENKTIQKNTRVYYLKKYLINEKKINGLFVTETDNDHKILLRIFADEVFWINETWVSHNVKIQYFKNNEILDKSVILDNYEFHGLFEPGELLISKTNSDYMTTKTLRRLIKKTPESNIKLKIQLLIDYYRKFSFSFVPFTLLIIAIPFSIAPVRTSSTKNISFGIVLALLYYIVDTLFCQAGKGMIIPPVFAAWMANIIFLSIGVSLYFNVEH